MGFIEKIFGKKKAGLRPVVAGTPGSGSRQDPPSSRMNYDESCRRLQQSYLNPGAIPPQPDHLPRHDDAEPLRDRPHHQPMSGKN